MKTLLGDLVIFDEECLIFHLFFCCWAEVQFTTSGPGENCAEACGAIEEECIEDMLILQSAEDVESWAFAAGVQCASIIDRCDIGESPIFNYSIWENENLCTFCSNPNHPGWLNGNRCEAKYQVRERICPCTSTFMGTTDSPVKSTTAESTTELTDSPVESTTAETTTEPTDGK